MKQIKSAVVVLAALTAGWFTAGRTWAGSLDALAPPTSSNSAMFTLEDLYHKLDTPGTNVAKRTGGFTEPAGEPTNGTMHTLDDIMTLVTNRAPAAKTGQTASYRTGDDGTYQKGVAWPNPRFATNALGEATNVVTDNLTGLMWARNANLAGGTKNWADAISYCTNLNYGGYTDWRLPNVKELQSIIHLGYYNPAVPDTAGTGKWTTANEPFAGVQSRYWTSTSWKPATSLAWIVDTNAGYVSYADKTELYYVWPVRGGL